MKLYLEKKVFSWGDRFAVMDEGGQVQWSVRGEVLTLGRKLHVYGADGTEAAFVRRKVMSVLRRYFIEVGGAVHEIVKEISPLHPRYDLPGLGWTASGNFLEHDYLVSNVSGGEIVRVAKAYLSWGEFYELDIADGGGAERELLCLCVALAIECIHADAHDLGARVVE